MNIAHEAYQHWKAQYKILLQTFSDEQMFSFGFEAANGVNEVMQQVVADLEAQVKELTERLSKLEKPKKTTKQTEQCFVCGGNHGNMMCPKLQATASE